MRLPHQVAGMPCSLACALTRRVSFTWTQFGLTWLHRRDESPKVSETHTHTCKHAHGICSHNTCTHPYCTVSCEKRLSHRENQKAWVIRKCKYLGVELRVSPGKAVKGDVSLSCCRVYPLWSLLPKKLGSAWHNVFINVNYVCASRHSNCLSTAAIIHKACLYINYTVLFMALYIPRRERARERERATENYKRIDIMYYSLYWVTM